MTQSRPSKMRTAAAAAGIVALASAGVYSTSAFFNDTVDGTYSITSATADLNIRGVSDDAANFTAGPRAPSDEPFLDVDGGELCNDGDVPLHIGLDFNLDETSDLALANAIIMNSAIDPEILNDQEDRELGTLAGATPSNSGDQTIPAGECVDFDIDLTFPDTDEAQNDLQDMNVSGTFVFEGRTSPF